MASQSSFIWVWVYRDGNIIMDDVKGVKYDTKMTRFVKLNFNLTYEGLVNLLNTKLWTDNSISKIYPVDF